MIATTRDAYQLMHDGTLALAEVESHGMRIDVARLDAAIEQTSQQITEITTRMKGDDVWKTWKRVYGDKANMGSRPQIGRVLFKELGYKSEAVTEKGNLKVDETVLSGVDLPFVADFLHVEKLKKLRSTYLNGIRRELVGEHLRPSFNLHLVSTFRSSSDSPNFQNLPIRDPEMGKIIRSCFIPRKDHVLVEMDFGALEFRVAACFWKDPKMVEYASNPELDIHRDAASLCFKVPRDKVNKLVRYCGKNQFVFPQLYGSYFANCAKNLWESIGTLNLTVENTPMEDWLQSHGIKRRGDCTGHPEKGTFEQHIKAVEEKFFARFSHFAEAKEEWWERYTETLEFQLMTGFVCRGVYSRNNLMNTPIQGPAFHLLLWSIIQIIREMKQKKMQSLVVGQIHDSVYADVHKSELDEYIQLAKRVMTQDVKKHWDWIIVPLEVECEVAETNWFEKKAVAI